MRYWHYAVGFLLAGMLWAGPAYSQPGGKTALLPLTGIGVAEEVLVSAGALLRHELLRSRGVYLISEEQTRQVTEGRSCAEAPCAVEVGAQLGADRVIVVKLVGLGEKVIVEYMVVDVLGEDILLGDKATASYVEDLDAVMKRVAVSITAEKSLEKTAKVDNIIEQETEIPRRRSMRRFTSYSFGYLYPTHGYDEKDRVFTFDWRIGAETNDYEIGMLFGAHKGIAINLFGSYFFNRGDFTPYLGGGFGYHFVSHNDPVIFFDDPFAEPEKREEDGPELTINAGLRAFRTYNFQLFANLAYAVTFNDFDDRAFIFTIGIVK